MTYVLQAANLIMGLYLIWRCVWGLRIPRVPKVLIAVVLLCLIQHHWLVSRIFGTSIASPELPSVVLMGLGVAYGALLLLFLCVLLRDLIGLVLLLASRRVGRAVLNDRRIVNVLAVVCVGLSVVSVWQAVKVPAVKEMEISLPGLAPELDGYRMALLTDLHVSRLFQQPWVDAVVEKTNALNPDIIVIAGDLVDGTVEDRRVDVAPLSVLSASDGVYAVAGNHEYYAGYLEWMDEFERLGIRMLENEHVTIQPENGGFVLAGVPDIVARGLGQPDPDIELALSEKPQDLPAVLLDHRPGNFPDNQSHGVDLQLSGHTHGGHVTGLDRLVRQFNNGFVSGPYHVDQAMLYVSNGAGLWPGFPTRLGRPSEVVLITLRAA